MDQEIVISLTLLASLVLTVALSVVYCKSRWISNKSNVTPGSAQTDSPLEDLIPAEEGRISHYAGEPNPNEAEGILYSDYCLYCQVANSDLISPK